jgi:hypothetical protein
VAERRWRSNGELPRESAAAQGAPAAPRVRERDVRDDTTWRNTEKWRFSPWVGENRRHGSTKTVRAAAVRSLDVDTRSRGRCGARAADEGENWGGGEKRGAEGWGTADGGCHTTARSGVGVWGASTAVGRRSVDGTSPEPTGVGGWCTPAQN